jgi:hypothetical protein
MGNLDGGTLPAAAQEHQALAFLASEELHDFPSVIVELVPACYAASRPAGIPELASRSGSVTTR